ncbi:hypothetical protein [Solibacillus sp. CAU 1738]|uniref:hypothetical protein n=1 Tax=Solibacillus sp. CAU 1738 TaxID=3140363 RepID=UPI00326003AA
MKLFFKIFIGLLFAFTLTGCIGEDYDVGVPTAQLRFDFLTVQLTEANISWNTASEDVQKSIKDIEKYAASLDEIKVFPGQKAYLDFEENEKNGGDIWTDPQISAVLLKDDQRTELLFGDYREFQFPTDKGRYVLEVKFRNTAGSAQYVGNIVIGKVD